MSLKSFSVMLIIKQEYFRSEFLIPLRGTKDPFSKILAESLAAMLSIVAISHAQPFMRISTL